VIPFWYCVEDACAISSYFSLFERKVAAEQEFAGGATPVLPEANQKETYVFPLETLPLWHLGLCWFGCYLCYFFDFVNRCYKGCCLD